MKYGFYLFLAFMVAAVIILHSPKWSNAPYDVETVYAIRGNELLAMTNGTYHSPIRQEAITYEKLLIQEFITGWKGPMVDMIKAHCRGKYWSDALYACDRNGIIRSMSVAYISKRRATLAVKIVDGKYSAAMMSNEDFKKLPWRVRSYIHRGIQCWKN